MKRFPYLFLSLLAFVASTAQAQTQYSLRQYLSIRSCAAPSMGASGRDVAFVTALTGTAQVWKVPTTGGWSDQLTFFGSSISSVTWSPIEEQMIVVADIDGNEQFQLFLVKADGTQTVNLTNDPKVRHSFGGWSKDGKSVYYASNARDPRYFDCYIMDLATRQTKRVYQKNAILEAVALSNDNRWLVANEAASNVNNNLYLVDLNSGQARALTQHSGDAMYDIVGFTHQNQKLMVVTNQDRDFMNLASVDLADGKLTFLRDESHDLFGGGISPDGKNVVLLTNNHGYGELSLLDATTLRPKRLPMLPKGSVGLGGFSADSKRLAISVNTPTKNTDVWILDIASNRLKQVTFSSRAGIDAATFAEPSLIKVKSFDGMELPAFLYLPKNAPQDHSVPVILSVHGGPEGQERPFFTALYQYFVSRGFAVLAPNIRGSAGYGTRYLAMDNGPKRWDALKDLAALTDWVGTHPSLNGKKIAVMGGSYGGFATLAMLVHYPEKYAAGIDLFGIADFKTFLANTAPFRRPLRIAEYGDPVKDSEFLDAISPARHVERIRAPLLVIQGANDPRVPESESALIVQKVKEKGGVVEYLLFPDEGHGVAKLPNRIRAYETVVAFLNKHLK